MVDNADYPLCQVYEIIPCRFKAVKALNGPQGHESAQPCDAAYGGSSCTVYIGIFLIFLIKESGLFAALSVEKVTRQQSDRAVQWLGVQVSLFFSAASDGIVDRFRVSGNRGANSL